MFLIMFVIAIKERRRKISNYADDVQMPSFISPLPETLLYFESCVCMSWRKVLAKHLKCKVESNRPDLLMNLKLKTDSCWFYRQETPHVSIHISTIESLDTANCQMSQKSGHFVAFKTFKAQSTKTQNDLYLNTFLEYLFAFRLIPCKVAFTVLLVLQLGCDFSTHSHLITHRSCIFYIVTRCVRNLMASLVDPLADLLADPPANPDFLHLENTSCWVICSNWRLQVH